MILAGPSTRQGRSPMRRHGTKLVSVFIFVAAVLIAACAKPYHEENERYVFVATNINLPYWQEAQAGFLDAARALGVKAEMTGPVTYDPSAEVGIFRQVAEQHPAGICLSAARPEIFQADIDKAVAQGIPVICVDADVPNSKRILYIGTDNFKAGRESMKRMAALISGRGNICLEATGGPGAASALHRLDLEGKVPIVAFDKDPDTLGLIEKGAIASTIAQKPYVMSYYGLKFLDDLHHNAVREFKDWRTAPAAPLPTWVDTGTAVVDKSNLAAFREALSALPKP